MDGSVEAPGSSWRLLAELDHDDRTALSDISELREYEDGDLLIEQGQPARELLLILNGRAQVLREEDGVVFRIANCGPGHTLGEVAFLTGREAMASVRCDGGLCAAYIRVEDLEALCERSPGLYRRLCNVIAEVTAARMSKLSQPPELASVLESRAPSWKGTLANIRAIELSPLVHGFVERYETVAHRDDFLWRWAAIGVDQTRLSCVPLDYADYLRDTKLLAVILNVLLDDIADRHRSAELLELAIGPLEGILAPGAPCAQPSDAAAELHPAIPAKHRPYFQLILDLWQAIAGRCGQLPNWAHWAGLWRFDYRQVFNCMRYALLLGEHRNLANVAEHGLYPPHNMNMMVFSTMDLMCSPGFDTEELGWLREVVWSAQSMGQISNMTATWRRELRDRDYTSRVYVRAVDQGLLTHRELDSLSVEDIEDRITHAELEYQLLAEWHEHRRRILARADRLKSVDVRALVAGLESLLGMTLAARDWL